MLMATQPGVRYQYRNDACYQALLAVQALTSLRDSHGMPLHTELHGPGGQLRLAHAGLPHHHGHSVSSVTACMSLLQT